MVKLVLYSYAKLNLYLEVINKRRDGFHNIKTLFERVNLSDKIILNPRRDRKIRIICSDPLVPKNDSNLCYRSAKLLQKKFGITAGLDIKIIKRIPVGAGLGGGSGNAAFTLLGLNRLWRLNIPCDKLACLAKEIGCDVPFFVYDTPFALGTSRGDKITILANLKRARFWHILVVPRLKVSTPLIYRKWDAYSGLTRPRPDVRITNLAAEPKDFILREKSLFNSLEPVTVKLYPEVRRIKEKLLSLGIKSVLMSGSGPAVFGIVSSRKEAVSLKKKLKRENSSWRVFTVSTF